jgi:L-amino acid N-acyltransferase YncA
MASIAGTHAIIRAVGVRIRRALPSDAAAMIEIYRPFVEGSAVSFEEAVPTPEEFGARIESGSQTHPWFAAELDGELVGYAYASVHRARASYRWSVEVSVYVAERSRRAGVARALYTELFDQLRGQGFVNAYAGITLPNDPSVRFHAAMGFAPIGVYERIGYKLGKWHDVGWYALRLREDDQPSTPSLFIRR